MSRPGTPSAKTTTGSRSHRDDVLSFLDNLDSFEGPGKDTGAASSSSTASASRPAGSSGKIAGSRGAATQSTGPTASAGAGAAAASGGENPDDPQAVLDFLDEIVANRDNRRSTTPGNNPGGLTSSSSTGSKKPTSSTSATSGVVKSGSRNTLRDGEASSATASSSGSRTTRDTTAPAARKSGESTRSINMTPASHNTSTAAHAAEKLQDVPLPESTSDEPKAAGGWGWGSVWSQASNVLQQARTVAEEQAKHLPKNLPTSITNLQTNLQSQLPVTPSEATSQAQAGVNAATAQAQKWRSGMMNMLSNQLDIDKLRREITETGMKAMQDIMNAVAPPIAEHEVIQVNLSHDMLGYEGVETLVYRALAKVMEQVEGGDLVVNKGHVDDSPSGAPRQAAPKAESAIEGEEEDERNLNTVEGFVEGYKLAEANLDALIKKHYRKPEEPSSTPSEKAPSHGRKESGITIPVTICPVYMRIQPVLATMPFTASSSAPSAPPTSDNSSRQLKTSDDLHLFFILVLRDPTNELVHKTLTQSMPSKWLDIPFEENEWVEDIMVDVIRRGVEIIGEEYIKGRMHGRLFKNAKGETVFEEEENEETEQEKEERGERMSEAQAGVSA